MFHLIPAPLIPAPLIPAPLHRQLYRAAFHARRLWLRWRGGTVRGCAIIAFDGGGRVLLVRHSYGSGNWTFPGGGLGRGEPPEMAARRELREETGCELADMTLLAELTEEYLGAENQVHVFTGRAAGQPCPDDREIIEAAFFPPDQLPQKVSIVVHRRLALLPD